MFDPELVACVARERRQSRVAACPTAQDHRLQWDEKEEVRLARMQDRAAS